MSNKWILVNCLLGAALSAQITRTDKVPLRNWPAPLYWQPSQAESVRMQAEIRTPSPEAATPVGSLVFVAMTPCRVVDTRASSGFPSPFGPPNLSPNTARSFPIQSSTTCSIPPNAMAYSFNVTLVPTTLGTGVGYLTIWPTAAPPNTQPIAVTVDDYPTGDIRNNAAIVPAGITNGSVSAITNGNTDLVVDINGYFAPSTGITLMQGTASAPSLSFAADAGTGMFSSGAGILNFASAGTTELTIQSNGDLNLTGNLRQGGSLFLSDLGLQNLAVGIGALAANTGSSNTAAGYKALFSNTTGNANTASGVFALFNNQTGSNNTAIGPYALTSNGGSNNTAIGLFALQLNSTGTYNTAMGPYALANNQTGIYNTAIGPGALNKTNGDNNTAVGINAGINVTGSNNIEIGNGGMASDGTATNSGVIRIGDSSAQTSFFAAGISGVNVSGGAGVVVNSSGQLGVVASSRRYKEDIEDMNDASSGLLQLRPVTFRYRKPYADQSKPIDYGLIAEEVAEVYPDLVVKGADGQVETVQYHKLVPMLLNELQKEHLARQQQAEDIRSLQAQLAALSQQVASQR